MYLTTKTNRALCMVRAAMGSPKEMHDMANLISRRRVLQGFRAAGTALAAATALPALAAQKIAQTVAKYQDHPNGIQRCEICLQFEPPKTCKIVAGEISPKGWCQFFAAKENAQ
jgi:hypothetical protein